FDPWSAQSWDNNATVLIPDPSEDADVGQFVKRLPRQDYFPTWYSQRIEGQLGRQEQISAQKAAAVASLPSASFSDAMGRPCVEVQTIRRPVLEAGEAAHQDEVLRQASFLDVQGLPAFAQDTLGRTAGTFIYSLGGAVLAETNM